MTLAPEQASAPKIVIAASTETYGRFVLEPLQQGFGSTLGNAFRRVLLGLLPGTAITAVHIEGIQHEYASLPHVREDVIDFLLNVKGIRLRSLTGRPGILRLEVGGRTGPVTAGHIQPSGEYTVVNPEMVLFHLDSPEGRVAAEFHVEQGIGYRAAEAQDGQVIGLLPVDALFTPTRRVNFEVEPTRVGQVIEYDRLILEVWTDKTISPQDAVQKAAHILIDHLSAFAGLGHPSIVGPERRGVASAIPGTIAAMPLEELKLSSRTQNSLRRGSLATVGQVLDRSPEELLALRNFGDRSLEELYERLRAIHLPLPEGDDKAWRKTPLAEVLYPPAAPGTAPEEDTETPQVPAVFSSGGPEEAAEEEMDVSAFRRRTFSPEDEPEGEGR
ncbi:MAG: DNA-directed RNA polymerase subunit alpha [Chloroflexi bacterium]|nr:DNA-directed RNA polymerase subunit alpha [Chloroflexota bacterium]